MEVSCGLLVDYCDVFISCSESGTHSLQSIHWWANYVMLNFQKYVLVKNQTLNMSKFSEFFFSMVDADIDI